MRNCLKEEGRIFAETKSCGFGPKTAKFSSRHSFQCSKKQRFVKDLQNDCIFRCRKYAKYFKSLNMAKIISFSPNAVGMSK